MLNRSLVSTLFTGTVVLTSAMQISHAQGFEVDIPATSNVFYAGTAHSPTGLANCRISGTHNLGDGTLPPSINLGTGIRSLQFVGRNTADVRYGVVGFPLVSTPDGHPSFNTSIDSPIGTTRGFTMNGRHGMLGAAFVDDSVLTSGTYGGGTSGQTTFTPADMNAPTLTYGLAETFPLGDGTVVDFGATTTPPARTGTEQRQTVVVPTNATRLFFGFFDAAGIAGRNQCYQDNLGNIFLKLAMSTSDDIGSVEGGVGGTAIASVLTNDYLDTGIPTAPQATWTPTGTWTAGITLDTATGAVNVDASVPNATYMHDYELCDTTTMPESCMIATATIIVKNGLIPITANNDSGSVIGDTGGTAIANIRINDRLDGAVATNTNTTLATQGVWPAEITLDTTTGAVDVAPGTAAGSFSLSYQLCESADPTNCATAIIRIVVRGANANTSPIPTVSIWTLLLSVLGIAALMARHLRRKSIH